MAMRLHAAGVVALVLASVLVAGRLSAEERQVPSSQSAEFLDPGPVAKPVEKSAAQTVTHPAAHSNDAVRINATIQKTVKAKALPKAQRPGSVADTLLNEPAAVEAGYRPAGVEDALNVADGGAKVPINEAANDVVRGGFVVESPQGVLGYFKGKTLLETTFAQALHAALERNLAIRYADKGYEKSGYALTQAKAAFDPVFNLAFTHTQFDSYDRQEYITRRRDIGAALENEVTTAIFSAIQQQGPDQSVDGFKTRGAFDHASQRARNVTDIITESYTQNIPWGSYFNASFTQKRNHTIFVDVTSEGSFTILDSDVAPLPNPIYRPDGQNRYKRVVFYESRAFLRNNPYERPWTANLTLKLVVPVPYSKDWGEYGPIEVPIKLAKASREQAYWTLQGTVNDTLANICGGNPKSPGQLGYWDLVRAVRRLELTNTTRKGLETVLGKTDDLLKQGRATNYEKTLVQEQLAALRRAEQSQWQLYAVSSNAVRNQLDQDKEIVLLPVGYGNLLGGVPPLTRVDAIASAMQNNPDVQAAKANMQIASLGLKFSQNQARPDVKISAGTSFLESDAVMGYLDLGRAVSKLVGSPDTRNDFVMINYRVPWGNKPALELVHENESLYKQAQKSLTAVANRVEQNVNDAINALASAREQAAIAEKNEQIAQNLYKAVLDLWAQGRVPETAPGMSNPAFEIVNRNNDMVNAGFRNIDAQVNVRKAEAQLLAAQGLLASRFSEELKISIKPVEDGAKKEAEKAEPGKQPAK